MENSVVAVPIGRPALSNDDINLIFRKLEPHLKMGLSINRACYKASIPKSTVYDLYNENSQFAERIDTARNYFTDLINNIIHTELLDIVEFQKISLGPLNTDEKKFILWIAANSNAMKEYYCSNIQKIDE
ncbi:MAG: hypothetical protein A3C30_03480 [Candidatus Levybacteria bacterium RIFCSPHIGHO2_02_FULL_40_18]|uniref:Uncharacterized protein n=1 Tax=Candidatus Woesebacteria bacterium RIFCSPLOWO2_01_FULL_39_25 TaxID=1802521 RepID=A0A1F8BME3_9BACT|nr:MAG: hypothetical protein A3C30_03480 [Candidatus Levybacteria bacterium RIFCSPHIGHO2_02_FULL_40_18]OGH31400.1 MAG: hypothetical protein A3E43_03440 [Candidatus Levybacteria bacterium RIFCSPHIGHO2_12_FULL_40_31]OGH54245.1 MAG: hypothetical protein A3G15_00785 [Candidatus Levybacteria bacterium RIFCSPLOWO2_12_FULL_40_10]OGM65244.1 MAG: hypothetical protein A2893_00615 [Candidatus Woesebacteria bacterium RIFCSPLOWO2_01_FULL_39_25]